MEGDKRIAMRKVSFFVIISFIALSAVAQVSRGVEAITRQSCEAQVAFLSSDLLQGRKAGTAENRIAAEYLASLFAEMGYKTVFQKFKGKDSVDLQNVLIEIQGVDTSRCIVVGSHYDHLGVREGDIYNGADDNASGAVAIVQIAKAIKTAGLKPKYTIVLALWDAEEGGLWGSKHYVASCADPKKIVGYMNFDMIGRNSDETKPQSFTYFYTKAYPEYEKWLNLAIAEYHLDLKPDFSRWDDPTSGSDNASFAKAGVPICWYHTGGHADYHKPTDTVDKINWAKMVDIIRSSYFVAWQMANS